MPVRHPDQALEALCARLPTAAIEQVPMRDAVGRVLAQAIHADRDSPPCDVSSMDGYAVRIADVAPGNTLSVPSEVATGQAPPPLALGAAMRIFTGGAVPPQADCVVRREHVDESNRDRVRIDPGSPDLRPGANIRRQAENVAEGQSVVEPGRVVTPAMVSAMASFGVASVRMYRRVRLGVLVTGNEVRDPASQPADHAVRDANGPALRALAVRWPWVEVVQTKRVGDQPEKIQNDVAELLDGCDALWITGGVSMGDHDYVPGVLRRLGAEIVFHGLPVRPGKPILGALGPRGQAILGLPGNPVSALTMARRFGVKPLARLAGVATAPAPTAHVTLDPPDDQQLHLWWYRHVVMQPDGRASIVANRGSGDAPSVAASDGFVEQPPGPVSPGPLPYWSGSV